MALFGDTPEQAFYVKCDESTNPPEVRDLGQVITEIGAVVKPANLSSSASRSFPAMRRRGWQTEALNALPRITRIFADLLKIPQEMSFWKNLFVSAVILNCTGFLRNGI
jgi:hypothetical protein